MDAETVGPNGETIPEVKPLAFWGVAKRSRLNLRCHVVPALIVDDLGPDAIFSRIRVKLWLLDPVSSHLVSMGEVLFNLHLKDAGR
jgi:hypothetical protein